MTPGNETKGHPDRGRPTGRQVAVLTQLDEEDPYMTVAGFPCDPFTNISHMFPQNTKMKKLAIGMKHLQFVKQIWLNCKRRGAHMLLENPLTSMA